MKKDTKVNIRLSVISTLFAVVFFGGIFEFYENYEYQKWKKGFEQSSEWRGGLTVASSNPVLMWEYRPNAEYFNRYVDYSINTNNFGFRDKNFQREKKRNEFRTAFIGDSVTLGLGVKQENTFVNLLNRMANQQDSGATQEFMNFGIDGFNAIQISELLKAKVLQFYPNLVVYVLCINDFDFEDASGQKIKFFQKPKSFIFEKLKVVFGQISNYGLLSDEEYHKFHFQKNHRKVFGEIRKMKTLLDSKMVNFQIVIMPIFSPDHSDFENYPLIEIHNLINRELEMQEIIHLDLLDSLRATGRPPSYFSRDVWHPNNIGHLFIAEQIDHHLALHYKPSNP